MRQSLEMITVDNKRVEEILRRVEQALDEKDAQLIRAVFQSYAHVADLVGDKNTSIRRLRQLFFGAKTEKTAKVVGRDAESTATPQLQEAKATAEDSPGEDARSEELGAFAQGESALSPSPVPGHGRNGADAYQGATRIKVNHPTLTAGDPCPTCHDGTVYEKPAGVFVRITGEPPLSATIYELQKLRCGLCGQVFTASVPPEVGDGKYDATAATMIALLKYGTGLPFHRLEGFQGHLATPLPASTQWDVVNAVSDGLAPVFTELIRQAAQGQVLHNDDTTVKILDLMRRNRAKADSEEEGGKSDQRKGLFTTGVVALGDGHRVALFFSGDKHAGENLTEVLKQRAEELPPPVQMCDGLSRNLPEELRTIIAHCLAHARRRFIDVHDRFPDQCRHFLEALAVVYRNDALAKEKGLSAGERLKFHQQESGTTMRQLHEWLKGQLDEKRAEPNSGLGEAIRYTLKHWERLTLFLRQAGAPLDNNLCERALKKAILHRKNALFYKTQNGARVGDLFMSLIYTCQLNGINPYEYLNELQNNTDQLNANPSLWLPWNYRETLNKAG